jgi:HB1, ASXL, restriction endonuclease HTH domain
MAKRKAKGESAKQVARDVLSNAGGGPLPAKEIAKRVLESGRCKGLKGKTPEATITAMLAVGSKPGGPFKRADKGTYALADQPANGASGKDADANDTATKDGGTKDEGVTEPGGGDAQAAEAERTPGKQRRQPTRQGK